ncbi:MAG: hypothetical protein DMG76_34550 [Acidobacteria bacterium]|nr:MAG: hypothetical protein DMG76_34550 [Acidobacteriota bacterium]
MAGIGQSILRQHKIDTVRFLQAKDLRGLKGCTSWQGTCKCCSFKSPSITLFSRLGGHEMQLSGAGLLTRMLDRSFKRAGGHFAWSDTHKRSRATFRRSVATRGTGQQRR